MEPRVTDTTNHPAPMLAPCPFCGGGEDVIGAYEDNRGYHHIGCNDCDAWLDGRRRGFGTPQEAEAAWNRRAEPRGTAPTAREVEAMRAMLHPLAGTTEQFKDHVDALTAYLARVDAAAKAPAAAPREARPASEAMPGKTYWLRWRNANGTAPWQLAHKSNDGWLLLALNALLYENVREPKPEWIATAQIVELAPPGDDPPAKPLSTRDLRIAVDELVNALRGLHDEQNDAPLETRREQWKAALDESERVLAKYEAVPLATEPAPAASDGARPPTAFSMAPPTATLRVAGKVVCGDDEARDDRERGG